MSFTQCTFRKAIDDRVADQPSYNMDGSRYLSRHLSVAAAVYLIVMRLAVNDRVRAFKGLSPGMLPPLGILFGLLVGFMAAQVWTDFERAKLAVGTEASALRTAKLLAGSFTGDTETRLRTLINRHIEEAVNQEWPEMAQQQETLRDLPITLIEALKITLALTPNSESQKRPCTKSWPRWRSSRCAASAHHPQ